MDVSRLLVSLRGQFRLVAVAIAAGLLLATAVTMLLPRRYVAEASVLVDARDINPVSGMPTQTGPMAQAVTLATQVDVLRSERVARQVVDDIGLPRFGEVRPEWIGTEESQAEIANRLTQALMRDLTIRSSGESSVIQIQFAAPTAAFAAEVANAFATAYLKIDGTLKLEAAQANLPFLAGKVNEQRDALLQARSRLSQFQQAHGLLDVSTEKIDAEITLLNDLNSRLAEARSNSSAQSARSRFGRSSIDVLQDPGTQAVQQDLREAQARLNALQARSLGPRHPEIERARADVARLQRVSEERAASLSRAMRSEDQTGQAHLQDMAKAVDEQRERVLQVQGFRDELATLQGDVDGARKSYDQVRARFHDAQMESQSSSLKSAMLVKASVPLRPASPKLLLNLAAGAIAGLLAALALVVVRDQRRPRLRGPVDITRGLGLPVLATIDVAHIGGRDRPVR